MQQPQSWAQPQPQHHHSSDDDDDGGGDDDDDDDANDADNDDDDDAGDEVEEEEEEEDEMIPAFLIVLPGKFDNALRPLTPIVLAGRADLARPVNSLLLSFKMSIFMGGSLLKL